MKVEFSDKLKKTLSLSRFNGYEKKIEANLLISPKTIDVYVYYAWNTALSESLYAPLQALEVALRNTIHNTATDHFNDDMWFANTSILHDSFQKKSIAKAKTSLIKRGADIKPNRIIAELSFGFWTSLFNVQYDIKLWHPLIRKTFPHMLKKYRTRGNIGRRLNKIRNLRNRIFHYEPIWYRPLAPRHSEIIERS